MGRFRTLAVTIALIAVMTPGTEAQIKNVLLEQHTGAWCGWCPDGTVVLDQIVDLYGDRVIGVKLHTGDAMAIPESSVVGKALGRSGVPTGSVDRTDFGGSVFLKRGTWKTTCEFQMRQRARAEVDCFYTLDKAARTVTIQVLANITESMDLPLRFNAYIIEDDVTGTGPGYDQQNYYSNRPGAEDHPYYSLPSVIMRYQHMKVVRKMIGGAWGVVGDLPISVKAGEFYSHTFTAQISGGWNIDKLHFVGLLQANADDNKEIINSVTGIEDGSLLNQIINSDEPATRALPTGSALTNTYTLNNVTDQEQTYTVTLSTTERTPSDWSAEFTSGTTGLATSGADPAVSQIVVPADSTAELSLTLGAGATLGTGDAKVVLELEGTPTVKRSRIVSGISSGIEHLLLETGSQYSLRPYLSNTVCADAVTLDPSDYLAFADEMTNVKVVIWNKGPSDGLTPQEIGVIRSTPQARTFLCGDGIIGSLSADDLSYFGLEWIGWNLEGAPPAYTIWLTGQPGDVITGNLGSHLEGHLIAYRINMVRIADARHVFPIMRFQNDGFKSTGSSQSFIAADDTIVGVRSTRNDTRTVLLGISPYVLAQQNKRRILVSRILDWLSQ